MALQYLLIILATLPLSNLEYIPPGPVYPCPKENLQLLHPCICEKGTDTGIHVRCENAGLAVLSVGLGNIAGLGLPIEKLVLSECQISTLYGPVFHRSTVRVLHIIDSPIKIIEENAFVGVNRTLQELYLKNTRIVEFPKDAFKILGNISILSIDGHHMTKLSKDIFAGSEAAWKLEKLHIANGLLNDIPVEAFQTLKKLKTLDLHGNRLATLKRNQFKGLRDTEVLDISYNNITKLDGSHIGDLTKLGWCNVSHNLIGDIPRGMFARNTVLKVLHLDNNKIKKLDTNSFRGMRFLRRLFLQDNQISDVGRGTFSAVTRIGTVDLARNKITKVDYQMFQQVKYAEVVNLAENQIKFIESQAFTDLYLATVNISHNQLSKIEPGAFQNCQNLTILDLSHNNLKNISKNAFDENSYAGDFTVAYNEFEDFAQIPIQNMTGIRVLNVSHNQITSIPRNAFPKLYELHTVDVSYNNLSEIYNAVFQNLFSLRYLNLSHNSMEVIKQGTFGAIFALLELDLSHNKLRDPSRGGFTKLASCRHIDVSYNQLQRIFEIPISLSELNYAHNNLTEIKANTWPAMNALLRLNLSSNMLGDNLSGDSFASLLTLQGLDLSGNEVATPPWQALNTLTSLQYLHLQDNKLTSLSKSAFGYLPTIFQLDLSNNQLADISQDSFKGLQQLQDLSLRNNKLVKIRNEAFKGLVAMRKLDLSHNNLERIDNKTHGLLDDCLSLEKVNLSYNKFGFLTKKMFPANPWIPYRLLEVDLSYNQIPVLTYDVTIGTKKLKKLILKGNILNDVRNNVLGNFTALEVLDLSDNQLTDLVSRTSDLKFTLPENMTELYVRNNSLRLLPVPQIASSKLRVLDVRDNKLDGFHPALVTKIRDEGMQVYFQGNILKCDCYTRPLKHLLNHMPPSLTTDSKYNITCAEPLSMAGQLLTAIDEDRLLCAGNIGFEETIKKLKGEEFDFVSEPDLSFRDVQYSQVSIYAHWFVRTTEDVADFFLFIRDQDNNVLFSTDVAYNLRFTTITIDKDLQASLQNAAENTKFDICVQAKKSNGFPRRRFPSQCQNMLPDFSSWPKKLTIDKRRLTKKRTYSWFGNNALRLVSDSILLTLCIFLGVCFRRLADFDI
ncbi:insulin like growth factor binding protein acid labile subunit convoluted [Choristoneura fumiferana]